MTDLLTRILAGWWQAALAGTVEQMKQAEVECPATFGSEQPRHSFIKVTDSSYDKPPYLMCAKCGARAIDQAQVVKGEE